MGRAPRRGRPAVPESEKLRRVSLSLTGDQLERLDRMAAERQTSVSEIVRELLEVAFHVADNPPAPGRK